MSRLIFKLFIITIIFFLVFIPFFSALGAGSVPVDISPFPGGMLVRVYFTDPDAVAYHFKSNGIGAHKTFELIPEEGQQYYEFYDDFLVNPGDDYPWRLGVVYPDHTTWVGEGVIKVPLYLVSLPVVTK